MLLVRSRTVLAFAVWALAGTLAGLGALAILTIGIFVLAAAALVAVGAALLRADVESMAGVLVGLGAPLAWIGWLNRDGPGEVCTRTARSMTCSEEWAPWPWFAAAVCCVVAGVALFVVLARRSSVRRSP